MNNKFLKAAQFAAIPALLKWLIIAALVAIPVGSASAFFLVSLELATKFREQNPWMIIFLPLAGFIMGLIFLKFGRNVEAGINLILEEIHNPQSPIPFRMTPLILFGTVASHIFGASVGREGTAVQVGGALADQLTRPLKLKTADRKILLMTGISAGFASVFGTPLAGAVFALEVLRIGKLRYDAIFPCLVSAILADRMALLWGVTHTRYQVSQIPPLSFSSFLAVLAIGAILGIVGMLFVKTTHGISHFFKTKVRYAPLRPAVGGVCIVVCVYVFNGWGYLGLGIPNIEKAFFQDIPLYDFASKFFFTALSIGSGFKGGEVTPLFFIGATLGNSLSHILAFPSSPLAAIGFVAIFAGATNTPIAAVFMAIELFGPDIAIFASLACVASFLFSGHAGIYGAQKLGAPKLGHRITTGNDSKGLVSES